MVADCPFPFVTRPNDTIPCTTSYATAAGSAYVQMQIVWLVMSGACFLLSVIQNIRLWRIKGIEPRLFLTNLQHQIFGASLITTLFIMIRGIDPEGWSGRNFQAYQHLIDWTTIGDYVLLTLGSCSWLRIITAISGGQVIYVEYLQRSCIAILTCFVFIISLLKCYAHPTWLFYTMNLLFLTCLNITLISIAWIYGYRVQKQLSRSSNRTSVHKPDPSSPTTSPVPSPRQPTNTNTTLTRSTSFREKKGITTNQDKTVSSIFKLLVCMSMCTVIAVTLQLISMSNAISTMYDYRDRPEDVPQFTLPALLKQQILTFAQEAVALIALYFFRGLPSPSRTSNRHNSNSRHSSDKIKGMTQQQNHMHTHHGVRQSSLLGNSNGRHASLQLCTVSVDLKPTSTPTPRIHRNESWNVELCTVSHDHKPTLTPTPRVHRNGNGGSWNVELCTVYTPNPALTLMNENGIGDIELSTVSADHKPVPPAPPPSPHKSECPLPLPPLPPLPILPPSPALLSLSSSPPLPPLPPPTSYRLRHMNIMTPTIFTCTLTLPTSRPSIPSIQLETHIDIDMDGY